MSDAKITLADGITNLDAEQVTSPLGGFVLRERTTLDPSNAVRNVLFSAALAADASVDLNGAAVSSGKVGKLCKAIGASSAACKWVVKTSTGTIIGTMFSRHFCQAEWSGPTKDYDVIAATQNFRITVTNLDALNAADVYCTLYWDETDP